MEVVRRATGSATAAVQRIAWLLGAGRRRYKLISAYSTYYFCRQAQDSKEPKLDSLKMELSRTRRDIHASPRTGESVDRGEPSLNFTVVCPAAHEGPAPQPAGQRCVCGCHVAAHHVAQSCRPRLGSQACKPPAQADCVPLAASGSSQLSQQSTNLIPPSAVRHLPSIAHSPLHQSPIMKPVVSAMQAWSW